MRSRTSRKKGKTFVTDLDGNTQTKGKRFERARAQCDELKEMLELYVIDENTDCRNDKTKDRITNSITRINRIEKIENEYGRKMKNNKYR